jgi:hypothetical protein
MKLPNREEIFKNCILSCCSSYNDEEEIICKTYELFFTYALLCYLHNTHLKEIEKTVDTLKLEYQNIKQVRDFRLEVDALKLRIKQLENENIRLTKQVEDKSDVKLHKHYYDLLKSETQEKDRLQDELNKVKSTLTVTDRLEPLEPLQPLDLSGYSVLFVGHPEAQATANKLNETFHKVEFLDGIEANLSFTVGQMQKVDFVLLQYEFVQHKCSRYLDLARECNKPIIRLKGTNLGYWLSQIDSEIRNYL